MSGIDVLAVLDELVADMGGPLPGTTGHQVAQAAMAVAELFEASAAGSVMDASGREALWFGPDKAERLRGALARCRGGAP